MSTEETETMQLDSSEELNDEKADAITAALFDDYINKYKYVLKKLEIAQAATTDALDEMENMKKIFDNDQITIMIKEYEELWQENISNFLQSGLLDEDIEKVEDMLTQIPKFIKEKYEERLAKEPELIANFSKEEREKIYQIIEDVHEDFKEEWSSVKAYKMKYDKDAVSLN
jgi:hypothetical protein